MAITPNADYETPAQMFEEVLNQLHHLGEKIRSTGAVNGFWDIAYEGNNVRSRKPKREKDIHAQIRLLLDDLELQKGLQVIPEFSLGPGRLDFLITGRTIGGQSASVCVEFKLAHARDLAHGLKVQLPEYMELKATDFGIYCVVYFGEDYPADISKFEIGLDTSKTDTLDFILPIAASNTGRPFLKSLILDVSKKQAPSKK